MPKKITIDHIIERAKSYLPQLDEARVRHAYEFAKTSHKNQKRDSGEPYIIHPLAVTDILLDLKPDEDSIIAALAHDVLEDTDRTTEDIAKELGESVVPLAKGMEKLGIVYYRGRERQIENLRKMFLAMADDIRVILIKLADRLHNMRTLHHIAEHKQKRIAEETLTIYAPIAARLGIYRMKNELEELCFRFLYSDEYERISDELMGNQTMRENIIEQSKRTLLTILKENGIDAEVEGRVKNKYSIYKKLKRKDKNYASELYDIFALRIIVKDEPTCYQVLGTVHKHWKPLARRFKDYIAVPKLNGYQSLHTTLIGLAPRVHNQPVEVQIRSREMHEIAQFGIAAHWQYKEAKGKSIAIPENKLNWVQGLVALHENLKNNNEFIENLSVDIFHDRIFVLTPKGDVLDLPQGATPIDFAYAIHTDVGNRCKGAKANGQIVPLDFQLRNGQVVEILTGNSDEPNRYWLSFVVTTHAKNKIKQWFNSQDKEELLKIGKEMVNQHLKRYNQSPLDPNYSLLKNYEGEKMTLKEREALLEKIGNGSVDVVSVIKKVLPTEKILPRSSKKTLSKEVLTEGVKLDNADILITGDKGYQTQIATCCMPGPGDEIIGYVTRGRGVSIHKAKCKMLDGLDSKRFIKASWSTAKKTEYEVKLKLKRQSRIGMLRDVADVFASNGLPILDIENKRTEGSDVGDMFITASFDSLETLNTIIEKLEKVPGIFSVTEVD